MSLLWLPDAVRNEHGRELSWSETTNPKGCLHTTETSGWPGYAGWTTNPHGTIMPTPNVGVTIRQHIPLNRASFSLRNLSGGVETNRDFTFQWELIGTSEKGGPGYYWPGADDVVLLSIYKQLIKPLSEAYDIPIKAITFQAYPASYGAKGITNKVRLSGAAFDTYSGWLGHQHVPENVHGDPGSFPWDRMIKLAEEDDMALSSEDKAWLKAMVKNVVLDSATVKELATKLFSADVIEAPDLDLVSDPGNPTWQLRSYLNRLASRADSTDEGQGEIKSTLQAILDKLNEEKA